MHSICTKSKLCGNARRSELWTYRILQSPRGIRWRWIQSSPKQNNYLSDCLLRDSWRVCHCLHSSIRITRYCWAIVASRYRRHSRSALQEHLSRPFVSILCPPVLGHAFLCQHTQCQTNIPRSWLFYEQSTSQHWSWRTHACFLRWSPSRKRNEIRGSTRWWIMEQRDLLSPLDSPRRKQYERESRSKCSWKTRQICDWNSHGNWRIYVGYWWVVGASYSSDYDQLGWQPRLPSWNAKILDDPTHQVDSSWLGRTERYCGSLLKRSSQAGVGVQAWPRTPNKVRGNSWAHWFRPNQQPRR